MASGTNNLYSQFRVQDIVEYPCDARFSALLNQSVQIKRPYDAGDTTSVNEYGEVVMKSSFQGIAPVIATVNMRVNPKKGEGLKTSFNGKVLDADLKLFCCPFVNVQANDRILVGEREMLVLRVDKIFSNSKLHHLEILSKDITYV